MRCVPLNCRGVSCARPWPSLAYAALPFGCLALQEAELFKLLVHGTSDPAITDDMVVGAALNTLRWRMPPEHAALVGAGPVHRCHTEQPNCLAQRYRDPYHTEITTYQQLALQRLKADPVKFEEYEALKGPEVGGNITHPV